jgi:DNA-binding transcriptional LysR family regulator
MAEPWDDLRFLLALARQGTLTAAASSLGVSQPTVGRRIAALERRLGTPLFERTASGYRPSETGQVLALHAERIEEVMVAAEQASADKRRVRGAVKITSSEWLCISVLGPGLGRLSRSYPELTVELVAEARWLNVSRGESDVAVRAARFDQPGIVQRRVAVAELALYAAPSYLAQHGDPDLRNGSAGHRFLTLSDDAGLGDMAWLRVHAARAQVAARANGRILLAALAVGGGGLACLPRLVGDETAGLQRILASPAPPSRELWLGMRGDRRSLPRVRAVADFITAELEAAGARLAPGSARNV